MSSGIAIFVKTPGLSPVKTRLAANIGRARAEILHLLSAEAVAAVTREAALRNGSTTYWAVAEDLEATDAAWADLPRLAQGDGGLGERMGRIYECLRQRHGRALLLGADVPELTAGALLQACDWLAGSAPRLVIGPAADGGFWLFGGNIPIPAATWLRPEYGGAHVAAQFEAGLPTNARLLRLPTLHDIDRLEDLPPVYSALAVLHEPEPAQRRLREWIEDQLLHAGAGT